MSAAVPGRSVEAYDVKRERRDLYAPAAGRFHLVDVPPLLFLLVDGRGDPNTSPAYREAVEALYAASYAVRAAARADLGRVHVVGPLEGLWSADDLGAFRTRDKRAWRWTLMITQPEWITPELVDRAVATAARAHRPGLDRLRFERRAEGLSVQVLHVGPYDDEGPVLQRLHEEHLPAQGLRPTGDHHEIYLSDARRTAPARLRTVLHQPVSR